MPPTSVVTPPDPAPGQDRFRTVFENSVLGQKIIDPHLLIRQANAAVASMLGLRNPQDLVGRRILEFAHPHYRADWHDLQERLWEHKIPSFSFESCLIRADGSSFYCQVTSTLFPDEEGELGHTILEDIGPRKKLEESLKQLYDAQETMLHLAAHDLRTPLASIQLLTDLLERETAASRLTEVPNYLLLIQRACAECGALLRDVLYLGVLDAQRLEKQATDLGDWLDKRLRTHRLTAQQRGITLTLSKPAAPVSARLHHDKFGRVVDNLLTNALKFTPTGGLVQVEVCEQEGRPCVRVRDSGIGIPAQQQAHIFDKFNLSTRAGLHDEATTGLGLFIAKHIVELHGGHIRVESQEHEGTCFFIDLP